MHNMRLKNICRHCGGKGFTDLEISIEDFARIVDEHLQPLSSDTMNHGKIPAIKAVRTQWELGLKQAKDMVEAYMLFIKTINGSLS